MGEVFKTVLGRISGRVGDVIFRQRAGKSYVASEPGAYPETADPVILARRKKFGTTIGFASAINSIADLQKLWVPYAPEGGSAFNQMVKTNYPYVGADVIGSQAMITPDLGFAISTTSLDLTETGLAAVLAALGTNTGIDDTVEMNIAMAAVVHLSDPVVEGDKPDEFLSLISASQMVDLVNPLTFNIALDSIETQLFNAYQTVKIFAALFTTDANGDPVRFSTTLAG